MLRLMTMMLVLCVPAVSFADIYFCTSDELINIRPNKELRVIEDESATVVIDPEQGARIAQFSEEYSGTCRNEGVLINCRLSVVIEGQTAIADIYIKTETLEFSTSLFAFQDFGIVSFAGSCTKA